MTPSIPASIATKNPVIAEEGRFIALPIHFGWPADEQQAFEEGRGLSYLGHLGVVRVSGPDRLSWITTLSSQIVSDLGQGSSKELLLLDPQGRIQFAAGIVDDGDAAYLITEFQFAGALADFLRSMQFMLRVEVEDVSQEYASFVTDNEKREGAELNFEVAKELGGLVWRDAWPDVVEGGAAYFQGKHPEADFRLYLIPTEGVDQFVRRFSCVGEARMVGLLAAEATRVGAWRPLPGSEVDDRAVPAELDWLRTAVHTNKGCYCGQESVARIINLGRPPRRLTFLQLDGSAERMPEPGTPVELNGRQVGVLTSVAQHYEMGPIGLALLKRNLDPAAQLNVGEVDALQELIVPVDGRSDHAPDARPGEGLKRLDAGKRDIRTHGPGTQR
ncbi:folate-binding protein [Actinomycetaceae bacterium MB13-C1-2]|nr:folate-binding protein [Actinomycetaceae bacterium MB13-C1-2]